MPVVFPDGIVGRHTNMYSAFLECARDCGDSRSYATELVRLLPQELKEADVWHDNITSLWRYNYGPPYDNLPNNRTITGANDNPRVDRLYLCLRIADKVLSRPKLLRYLERLGERGKHGDVVFEMRPAKDLHCGGDLDSDFEVSEHCAPGKTCDWYFRCSTNRFLVEVKNRTATFLHHMTHVIRELDEGQPTAPVQPPDPSVLFRSVEDKFVRHLPHEFLQGVWIQSGIREHRSGLERYFASLLDENKIHFAVLSGWNPESYLLAKNDFVRKTVSDFFGLKQSLRLVTDDYAQDASGQAT